MKCRSFWLLAIAAVAFAVQTAKEVPITAEPHHHQVLENKYVRVFKVEVPSQQATLMHRHQYDYAYVTIGATELLNQIEGKPAANLKLQDGETRFSPGPFAHLVRDLAPTPFRNVTIEFLRSHRGDHSSSGKWGADRGLQILNGGTQEILFVKDDVRASDVQLNPQGTMPRADSAVAELIVAVREGRLQTGPDDKHSGEFHLSAGDMRWLQPARPLVNTGRESAHFICFEFH
jgi:hypothetical protein